MGAYYAKTFTEMIKLISEEWFVVYRTNAIKIIDFSQNNIEAQNSQNQGTHSGRDLHVYENDL